MYAKDYIEGRNRMTNGCTIECKKCPFSHHNTHCDCSCVEFEYQHPNRCEKTIELWLKKNPFKSYKDVLKERMPNIDIEKITKKQCIETYFGKVKNKPECRKDVNCQDCWNKEFKPESL